LRVPPEDSAHSQKEFSPLDLELVLREIPGKSVERCRRPRQRHLLARLLLRGALLDPSSLVVFRVARSPRRLRLLSPRCLALRLRAGSLPVTHPLVRLEPAPALSTRTLPGRHGGHRLSPARPVPLRAPPLRQRRIHSASGWVTSPERRRGISGERWRPTPLVIPRIWR